jgi:hypothetical protein
VRRAIRCSLALAALALTLPLGERTTWAGPPAAVSSESSAPAAANGPTLSEDEAAHLQISTEPGGGKTTAESDRAPGERDQALGLPPPARPRHAGLVLETTLGMLGFVGQFRHVSPPAYWLHGQLGYEIFPWLMVFGEGEMALTDTSESQDESHNLAYSMFGFGGGVRATLHATSRVAIYAQGDVGALTANVPHDSLKLLGYPSAETLDAQFGGRIGVDWYQVDRHMALCAALGGRLAEGFAKQFGPADTPLLWDIGAGVRYTF